MVDDERIKKVFTMYKEGMPGEKNAAKNLLHIILSDSGITLEEYERALKFETGKKEHKYSVEGEAKTHLFMQTYYMITDGFMHGVSVSGKKGEFLLSLSDSEKIEMDVHWDIYEKAFEAEVFQLAKAFIYKNHIFPAVVPEWAKRTEKEVAEEKGEEERKKEKEETFEERCRRRQEENKREMKLQYLVALVDRVTVRKQVN